jgi:hypothetical protein
MADIKRRIAEGVFTFAEEFPDYRLIKQIGGAPPVQRTCNQVFDEFLLECQSRVAKKILPTSLTRVPQASRANLAARDRSPTFWGRAVLRAREDRKRVRVDQEDL